jgi:hypothetical protein
VVLGGVHFSAGEDPAPPSARCLPRPQGSVVLS